MRNTWAAYLINTKTNQTIWTLGGKASSFHVAANAAFAWQHDVQMLPGNKVSLFNDNCCEITGPGVFAKPNGASGGLVLTLNTASHTASLASSYTHKNRPLDPAFLGSMNVLPNGNALVGWGSQPYFSEYSKTGQLLLDAVWPGKDLSYRAEFSGNWVGTPYFPPSGAARKAKGKVTVYASWDGATQVTAWKVLAGSNPNHLPVVATKPSPALRPRSSWPRAPRSTRCRHSTPRATCCARPRRSASPSRSPCRCPLPAPTRDTLLCGGPDRVMTHDKRPCHHGPGPP